MRIMFLTNIVFISFLITLKCARSEDELLAVSLMYRHGDRTPIEFYPKDPHKDPFLWPGQPGELTNIGKQQHYELEKWLRHRYDGFLSPIFNTSEIYIRSSDKNRCLMSAASNLAGLYPPQGKDVWNNNILWQPIPIHTLPVLEDDILEAASPCPKLIELMIEAEQLPFFRNVNEANKDFFQHITKKSGMNITEVEGSMDLFDILHIETIYTLTLPDWALEAYSKLENLYNIGQTLYCYTTQLTRLNTGRFYENLYVQFMLFSDKKHFFNGERNEKFRVFSAHDVNIFCLLDALKVGNLTGIPYAGALIFELRKSELNELYVQVLYKTNRTEADIVQIKDCDSKCDLDKFFDIIKPFVLTKDEFNEECSY